MAFPTFNIGSFDPGVAKRPSGSAFTAAWQGSVPSAYCRYAGWRSATTGRLYFPTGVTTPSKPRFRLNLSTTLNDLVSASFGRVFVGLATNIPPTADSTAISGSYAGVTLLSDTDSYAERRIYPVGGDGVTEIVHAGGANINSYLASGTMVIEVWATSDNYLTMRLDGVTYTTSAALDLNKTWAYFIMGSLSAYQGTGGADDATTDFDYRLRALDLSKMPVTVWDDAGAASPMVMG